MDDFVSYVGNVFKRMSYEYINEVRPWHSSLTVTLTFKVITYTDTNDTCDIHTSSAAKTESMITTFWRAAFLYHKIYLLHKFDLICAEYHASDPKCSC